MFLALVAGLCRAQAGLSQEEAVNQALQSRASLKAEAERVAAAEGLKKQAGLRPNPEFQFQNENLRPGQTYTPRRRYAGDDQPAAGRPGKAEAANRGGGRRRQSDPGGIRAGSLAESRRA